MPAGQQLLRQLLQQSHDKLLQHKLLALPDPGDLAKGHQLEPMPVGQQLLQHKLQTQPLQRDPRLS